MTTDPKTETIITRIKGLLRKAEGTDNEHEAEAFFAKATELMDKYRVDPDAVRDADHSITHVRYDLTRCKYLRASLTLLGAVAKHYAVVVTIPHTGNSKSPQLHGEPADIDAVLMMFGSLVIQRDRASLRQPVRAGVNANKFRNSFCYGYAIHIHERLTQIRKAQEAVARSEGNTMALEVYNREAMVRASIGKLSANNQNRARLDGDAVNHGAVAASTADLGGSRLGSSGPMAIGRAS